MLFRLKADKHNCEELYHRFCSVVGSECSVVLEASVVSFLSEDP